MATEPKQRLKLTLLKESIAKLTSYNTMAFEFNRFIERAGCSCAPMRRELKALDDECEQLQEVLNQSDPFKRRDALRHQIRETDAREHGPLDEQANLAFPFFRVWLFEQLVNPEGSFELTTTKAAAEAYAAAWLGGWRPKGG